MTDLAHGFVVVLCSTICYGSYFVPAKKYEIHDGLVFQWYQCSGIMLAGTLCALVRNNWHGEGECSLGFYVAPEGLLMGLLFQVANITATVSVKLCGLGNYYTIHQVSNLGLTFIVGIFGPKFGIPATPPSHIALAGVGFLFVLLGMIPVMFMEKEPIQDGGAGAGAAAEEEPAADSNVPAPSTPSRLDLQQLFSRDPLPGGAGGTGGGDGLANAAPSALAAPPAAPTGSPAAAASTAADSRRPSLPRPLASVQQFRAFNARTWDGTLGRPRLGEDEPLAPMVFLGSGGLVVKESPILEALETQDGSPSGNLEESLLPAQDSQESRSWMQGVALSLLAGVLYSGMYIPLLPWKARMKAQGLTVQGFDSFFSMCVGLYVCSSFWLLCGGAWKRYRGQRVEKSVLRPALISGMIYAGGSFSFLYAMTILPYAIGYALGVGGGLAVSLLWGTLVFGEASSPFNRRCVALSFAGVISGIVLLGLSA